VPEVLAAHCSAYLAVAADRTHDTYSIACTKKVGWYGMKMQEIYYPRIAIGFNFQVARAGADGQPPIKINYLRYSTYRTYYYPKVAEAASPEA